MISAAPQPIFASSFPPRPRQQALWCRACGVDAKLVAGYCSSCYAQRRWDRIYFGGLRAQVLARDNYHCQACGRRGEGKRSLAVHHRRPGISRERWLVTLCLGCHARVHRVLVWRPPFSQGLPQAVLLWREQHPGAAEQLLLCLAGFEVSPPETYAPLALELPF